MNEEYWLDTETGEVFNPYRQSMHGVRNMTQNAGRRWTEVLVRISKKVYDMLGGCKHDTYSCY